MKTKELSARKKVIPPCTIPKPLSISPALYKVAMVPTNTSRAANEVISSIPISDRNLKAESLAQSLFPTCRHNKFSRCSVDPKYLKLQVHVYVPHKENLHFLCPVYKFNDDHDNCYHQEYVDESACDETTKKSNSPNNDKDYCDNVKNVAHCNIF